MGLAQQGALAAASGADEANAIVALDAEVILPNRGWCPVLICREWVLIKVLMRLRSDMRDQKSLFSGALATTVEKGLGLKGVDFARTRYRSAMVCRQEHRNVPNRRAECMGSDWMTIFDLLIFRNGKARRL